VIVVIGSSGDRKTKGLSRMTWIFVPRKWQNSSQFLTAICMNAPGFVEAEILQLEAQGARPQGGPEGIDPSLRSGFRLRAHAFAKNAQAHARIPAQVVQFRQSGKARIQQH
jgi:hypothetical protein